MDTQEFIQKTFSLCQHQVETINPYTGDTILVPCGVCPACRYNKSIISQNKVHAQSLSSKYCYFLTLSYATRYIPRYRFTIKEVDTDNIIVSCLPVDRNPVYRTIVFHGKKREHLVKGLSKPIEPFEISCRKEYWLLYYEKANLSLNGKYPAYADQIPYLDHADLSLFMKRLRKRISQLGIHEQIHSYIVGEYGPKSFRPHFHLLLFFDSEKIAKNIIRFANSSWRFGRIDISASRGNAQDYCSGYLNSFSKLPLHLQEIRPIRPFSRFSNKFGYAFFRSSFEKAQKGDFSELLNGKSLPYNGFNTVIFPWRSVIDTCLYRPALRRRSSVDELVQVLSNAQTVARTLCKGLTPYQMPKAIDDWLHEVTSIRGMNQRYVMFEPLYYLCQFLRIDIDLSLIHI